MQKIKFAKKKNPKNFFLTKLLKKWATLNPTKIVYFSCSSSNLLYELFSSKLNSAVKTSQSSVKAGTNDCKRMQFKIFTVLIFVLLFSIINLLTPANSRKVIFFSRNNTEVLMNRNASSAQVNEASIFSVVRRCWADHKGRCRS